jgi:hypothetical protein
MLPPKSSPDRSESLRSTDPATLKQLTQGPMIHGGASIPSLREITIKKEGSIPKVQPAKKQTPESASNATIKDSQSRDDSHPNQAN